MIHDKLCPWQCDCGWPHNETNCDQCDLIADARKDERAAIVQDLNDLYEASLLAGPEWLGGIEVARDVVKDKQL